MDHRASPQLDLFDPDGELSTIGVTRRQLIVWWDQGLLSFDPGVVDRFERWQYDEITFLYYLTNAEPSVTALRKLLAPLKRPYTYDLCRWFYNFKERKWQRRYEVNDLWTTGIVENPERAGEVARALIQQLALVGARKEVFKTLAVLRRVIPDEWLLEVLPEE
jgi:hypothetical protein